MIGYRPTDDRVRMYNILREKYPSLPSELSTKALDKILTLLIEVTYQNDRQT